MMKEKQIRELAQQIVEHWDEWDEQAGQLAQVNQDPYVGEFEMKCRVADAIRSAVARDDVINRGMINVLADKLARWTGRAVPTELERANREVMKALEE